MQYNLTGTTAANVITGGALVDTINGGTGADTLAGGSEIDLFTFTAGDSVITIGGSGAAGTVSGFDVITGFALGTASANAETLDLLGVTDNVASDGAVNGNNSTLNFTGSALVESHSVSAGIATFDDTGTYAQALAPTTEAHLAAIVQYLQANDLGNAGVTLAFVVGSDTYVFQQGDDDGTNALDILIKLVGVTATSVSATNATTAGLIDIGG